MLLGPESYLLLLGADGLWWEGDLSGREYLYDRPPAQVVAVAQQIYTSHCH